MEEQTQNSVNLEVPSRWRRFSAYCLDLLINLIINSIIMIITYRLLILTNLGPIEIIFGIVIAITTIFNILFIINKKTTTWNKSVWIISVNNENNPINWRQAVFRYFVFNPAFLALILLLIRFIISLMFYLKYGSCYVFTYNIDGSLIQNQDPICETIRRIRNIVNRLCNFSLIFLLISIIEIFFKCPTFIDKRLWIKRIYKKSKSNE